MKIDGAVQCPNCGMWPKLMQKDGKYYYRCPRSGCRYHHVFMESSASVKGAANNWNEKIGAR